MTKRALFVTLIGAAVVILAGVYLLSSSSSGAAERAATLRSLGLLLLLLGSGELFRGLDKSRRGASGALNFAVGVFVLLCAAYVGYSSI